MSEDHLDGRGSLAGSPTFAWVALRHPFIAGSAAPPLAGPPLELPGLDDDTDGKRDDEGDHGSLSLL